MGTRTFLHAIILLLSASGFFGCNTSSKKESEEKATATQATVAEAQKKINEVRLDINTHPVPIMEALTLINATHTGLCPPAGIIFNIQMDALGTQDIATLKDSASLIQSTDPHKATGLKIWFTYNQGKLGCLYEPILFSSGEQTTTKTFSVYTNNQLYKATTTGLQFADSQDLSFIQKYEDSIRFRNPGSSSCRPFISSIHEDGDARSMLYSFQEIDSVQMSNTSPGVKFWSYTYSKNISGNLLTKHGIMLSPIDFNDEKLKLTDTVKMFIFKGKFANHANPCPPHCERVIYKCL